MDKDTGLYNFPQRYYDSRNVKWLTLDPIGARLMTQKAGSVTSLNWYNYCGNNPVMYSDPTGLRKEGTSSVTQEAKNKRLQNRYGNNDSNQRGDKGTRKYTKEEIKFAKHMIGDTFNGKKMDYSKMKVSDHEGRGDQCLGILFI